MSSLTSNTLLLVDCLNLSFRFKDKGIAFSDDYVSTIKSLQKSYGASGVILACDEGSSSYRKNLLPTYKQNRRDKRALQSEEEKVNFEIFFKEFLLGLNKAAEYFPLIKFPGVEADDIIAYICRTCPSNIWVISSDKDLDLLINDNVSRFSYVTRKEITKDNWNEHYEYEIDDHISIKCLMGDSGDDVPGVAGIGPKKAHALVKEYGTTYDIIASLPIKSKYKHIQSLNEFGANRLLTNYRLMDLLTYCDEALGKDNCNEIDKVLEKYVYNAD